MAGANLLHLDRGHPLPPPAPARTRPGGPAEAPLLSVITPSLDRADVIEQAVRSVLDSAAATEHIVVDGGSTDGTARLLASYPHLRVISVPGLGSHAAMNRGLAAARGAVIGFLNTDDRYAPGYLAHVAAWAAARPEAAMVCGRTWLFTPDDACVTAEIAHPDGMALAEALFGTPGFNAYFFRRAVFDSVGLFEAGFDLAADRAFLLRCVLAGLSRTVLDADAYFYARHAGSRTLDPAARHAAAMLHEHLRIADTLLGEAGLDGTARRAVAAWRAFESLQLAILGLRRGRPGAAVGMMARAVVDPGFVAALLAARRARRALAAAARRGAMAGDE